MFITFYSYKGGVGRTLALANIACLLAEDQEHPQKVLLWDFDLEAPGIHRLFAPASVPKKGFVNLLQEYAATNVVPKIGDFIYSSDIPGVDILSAGHVDQEYCSILQSIDWPSFFTDSPKDSGPLFSSLREQIVSQDYDYVLIDSRTGITDQGSICTQVLSELVVVVFRLTDQNLDGLQYLVPAIRTQLKARGNVDTKLLPVASEVPSTSSKGISERRDRALKIFECKALEYIRFDQDLVGDETLPCRRSEYEHRWPVPYIVEDYVRLCKDLRQRNPSDTKTLLSRLRTEVREEDVSLAFKTLKTLFERRANLDEVWEWAKRIDSGLEARLQKELDEIRSQVLVNDPANVNAIIWKGEWLTKQAKSIDAPELSTAKELLEWGCAHRSDASLFHILYKVLSCMGDLDGAVKALQQFLLFGKSHAPAVIDLADLHIRKGMGYFGSAIEEMEGLNDLDQRPIALETLACLHAFLGKEDRAMHYLKVLKESEDANEDRVNISEVHVLLGLGKENEALDIIHSYGQRPDAQARAGKANLAEALICAERFEEAAELMSDATGSEKAIGQLAKHLAKDNSRAPVSWPLHWKFTELLLFRERVKRKENTVLADKLAIIEEMIRETELLALRDTSSRAGRIKLRRLRAKA